MHIYIYKLVVLLTAKCVAYLNTEFKFECSHKRAIEIAQKAPAKFHYPLVPVSTNILIYRKTSS